jgi:hypothetical protein
MASRKAQMFVVTAVFLTSMLFVVQQIFITYASIDTSAPFKTKQVYVMKNIIDSVNDTIKSADDGLAGCQEFQKNLEELLSLLRDDVSSEGFIFEASPKFNCGDWDNTYPEDAPLSLSIRLSETYDISGNVLKFYHVQ